MSEVGAVGPGPVYAITDGGAIGLIGQPPVVDWWIGADDRWHQGSVEVARRQGPGESGTHVETRLRIPSGDAIHRVAAVPGNGHCSALIEIENDSPVPVALALTLAVRSGDVVVEGDSVAIDGRVVLRSSRPIARALVAGAEGDLFGGLRDGSAMPPAEADWPQAGTSVAVVLPLPHTAVLRFSLALDPAADALSSPNELPEFDAIGRGWAAHVAAAAEVQLPDDRLSQAVLAARQHLLAGADLHGADEYWTVDVEPWVPAISAMALQAWGHRAAAQELLLTIGGSDDLAVHATRGLVEGSALLLAWAQLLEPHPDADLEAALAPWIEQVALGIMPGGGRRRRRREGHDQRAWRAVGLAAAGSLLTRSGRDGLGRDIVDALPELCAGLSPEEPSLALALGANRVGLANQNLVSALSSVLDQRLTSLADIGALTNSVGAVGLGRRSQHPLASALLLLAIRRAVLDEPDGSGGPVAVLPQPDRSWWGAPIEGHRIPVGGGEIDFGVRWHGERPALLWDLKSSLAATGITCPGFDPSWSDSSNAGEALLSVSADPSLGAGLAPPDARRGRVLDSDDNPGSLS